MKKIISLLATSILILAMTVGCVKDTDAVATVNKNEITKGYLEKILKSRKIDIESQYGAEVWEQEVSDGVTFREQMKDSVIDQLIENYVVYDVAKEQKLEPTKEEVTSSVDEIKKNISSDEEYKKQMDTIGIDETFLTDLTKMSMTIQKYQDAFNSNTKITEDEMKEYYNSHKDEFKKDEVKASHILIKTIDENNQPLSDAKKKEAKKKIDDILKKIKDGEDFAKLAKENSEDSSAASGGDLGFFSRGQMVQEFEDAAFNLKVGEVSDVVETQYGYHIIKVTDKVNEEMSFDDSKDTIKQTLLEQKYKEHVESLKKKAKIEKYDNIIKKVTY
ncbi:MAG: peptidylprolyl isomerase [Clostridioides sp.]|jgi:foldase protein PrsA|nr:peptidylprolyl isomerase [Clostridioides sp.]